MRTRILFITAKDIQRITGCLSLNTAAKEYNTIKDSLKKEKHQKLTVEEYALYHGISKESVLTALNENK